MCYVAATGRSRGLSTGPTSATPSFSVYLIRYTILSSPFADRFARVHVGHPAIAHPDQSHRTTRASMNGDRSPHCLAHADLKPDHLALQNPSPNEAIAQGTVSGGLRRRRITELHHRIHNALHTTPVSGGAIWLSLNLAPALFPRNEDSLYSYYS